MNIELHDRVFDGWREFDSGRTHAHAGITFVNCEFRRCTFALDKHDVSLRPYVNNMVFRHCAEAACTMAAVIVEEVLIDELKTSGLFQTWAAVFKHVTLKGKIDRVMFSPFFHPGYPSSQFQQVIAKANADFYATVDWALDICEAEFKDFDCRGVPSRLIRRDPETQLMVTRERVLASGDAIAAGGQFWHSWLKLFLQDNWYADGVLVAPKRDKQFKKLVGGLKELRRAGVAEAD